MDKVKKRIIWMLVILAIFFTALLIDEPPNKEFLELTKITKVDHNAWLNFQNLASLNINAKAPVVKYQEIVETIKFGGAEKAKSFLTENESYLELNFDISVYCEHIDDKKVEFYDCLDDYVKHIAIIKSKFKEHSLILERINKSEHILDAKVDTQLINQIISNDRTMSMPDLFRANQSFKISHKLVALDKLYQVLESENKSQYCNTILIDTLENRYTRVENSNNLLYAIDSLVKAMYILDIAIFLTNNHPDLTECLNSLKAKKSNGILAGLHESMKQEIVALTLAFDGAAKELPWYSVFIYKHQKTLNDASKKYSQILSNLLEVDLTFFSQKLEIEEPSLLRHWNNVSGYFMMKLTYPKLVNLKIDFAMLSAKFNLVVLNARLKRCERLGNSNCDKILNDFKDPIWAVLPTLNKVEGTLSYIYTDEYRVTIPY